ncbi:S9 family peptidase [Ensifer sp. ENS11]|uniref:alpha/beta hydrolase family protein n=1 Tax=Ensifer sp. ENS11 TaxID=2769291 RepID=UPI0017840AF5|nr:prolyl oligopeptidase family serine peptidase [Ensifer sp. ENS11]MBD9490463.1 S9 family peptidase [Ensifer sp. ENS11]MDP9632985.1 dipeptidyl aminopeptidase/acylaminoacyl peptidase [Ensifer adhaerens]
MSAITEHLIDRGDGAAVELFLAQPSAAKPAGALLFVHGYQRGLFLGGREAVDDGSLLYFSSRLNVTAAAVSQPGFGASGGPADFCGPDTQRAILVALNFLKRQPTVDPTRIVIYGNSRGAVASAMVAARVPDLRAMILSSGVYDLEEVYRNSSRGVQQAIENEAGLSPKAFLDRSAIYHCENIRAEALLLHGKSDDRAPFDQAKRFAGTLSKAGAPVTLRTFECGHRIPRQQAMPILRDFLMGVFASTSTYH